METKRVARRKHSAQFRAEVLQACRQAGASVAAIALRNGLNANVVYRWLREDGQCLDAGVGSHAEVATRHGAEFIAVQLPQPAVAAASTDIRIEVHRGAFYSHGGLATARRQRVRGLAAGMAEMIRIDALWLAVEPVDMRAGAERLLARVVQVFGAAQAHHGYLFANARATRIKLLVHDGFGVWCAARRLNQGRFAWPREASGSAPPLTLTQPQFDALVLGLPWQRLEQMQVITRM